MRACTIFRTWDQLWHSMCAWLAVMGAPAQTSCVCSALRCTSQGFDHEHGYHPHAHAAGAHAGVNLGSGQQVFHIDGLTIIVDLAGAGMRFLMVRLRRGALLCMGRVSVVVDLHSELLVGTARQR